MSTAVVPSYADLDACVLQELGHFTVPGAAIGVLREGETDRRAYGVASLRTMQPVTPETLFQIGSISKIFTATLVMRLVDEGLLDLDTPVARYLPDLHLGSEETQDRVTLRHLLSHTSGIEGDRFDDYGWGDDALAKAIAEFDSLRQLTPPGELWSYCNSGFNLAGAVIEHQLETSFEAAIKERLLTPLELERSFFFAHEAIVHPLAVGHSQQPGQAPTVARPYPLPRAVNAAGGIIGSIDDLLRFAAFHLDDGILDGKRHLSQASARAMRAPATAAANFADSYGLGWALRNAKGTAIVGHGGSTNGFQAQLTLVPDHRFALAVLTNGDRGAAAIRGIERWALGEYLGITLDEPSLVEVSAEHLEPFAGVFRQPHAKITVAVEEGGLRVTITSKSPLTDHETTHPDMMLAPISAHEFLVREGEHAGSRVDFLPTDEKSANRIRLGGRLAERVSTE